MKVIEFLDEYLWGTGMGFFVAGIILLVQSEWKEWVFTIIGAIILMISSYIKGRYK